MSLLHRGAVLPTCALRGLALRPPRPGEPRAGGEQRAKSSLRPPGGAEPPLGAFLLHLSPPQAWLPRGTPSVPEEGTQAPRGIVPSPAVPVRERGGGSRRNDVIEAHSDFIPAPPKGSGRRSRALEGLPAAPDVTTERGEGCGGERDAQGLPAAGTPLPAALRSQPLPRALLAPSPWRPHPPSSARRTRGRSWARGCGGGVKNACRARTDNTCEAVSTPPAPRLQTAHLQRTWNFNSPHPPGGGRARAPGAGRDPHTAPSGARGIARPVLNQPAWAEGGRSERREERK